MKSVLIGKQGDEYISVDEVAEWLDTNTYEVVTAIAARATLCSALHFAKLMVRLSLSWVLFIAQDE